jgi:hypothetical protein
MTNPDFIVSVIRDNYDLIIACANIGVALSFFALAYQTKKQRDSLEHQKEIDSLEVLHQIRCQISYHWEKYLANDQSEFHFGELLAQYEYACLTCNLEHMSTKAIECFEVELVETVCNIFSGNDGKDRYEKHLSGPQTFTEIKNLLKRRHELVSDQVSFLKQKKQTSQP